MRLVDLFDKDALFRSRKDIYSAIEKSRHYDHESLEDSKLKLIFETFNQRTYLVRTSQKVYCILDDRRNREAEVRWSTPANSIHVEENIVHGIEIKDKKKGVKVVDFGRDHKGWLVTEHLFDSEDIQKELTDFMIRS